METWKGLPGNYGNYQLTLQSVKQKDIHLIRMNMVKHIIE